MRIYLDNCCFNRPYDDQRQISVSLDAQAKLYVQDKIKAGELELATSFVLNYENSQNPYSIRKQSIGQFINEYSSVHIGRNAREQLEPLIREIMETGIKVKDAAHVASAALAGCEFFLTTDKRLLKYKTDKLELITPVEFVRRLEEQI